MKISKYQNLFIFLLHLSIFSNHLVQSDCNMQNDCNGHGTCIEATSMCACFEGWGASTDITYYRAPDCSARSCPAGRAWADVPSSTTTAHGYAECSNRGSCNRGTGLCECFAGFGGTACQRTLCPNSCSGHGVCVSLKEMARMSNALPLAPNTFYEGDIEGTTWDEDMIYGCVCESSWTVGLGNGARQEPEWFGPDCSLKHCPTGDNPRTASNETDCSGKKAKDSIYHGETGNVCQVDCSNQGLCDHRTGECRCFDGQYGIDCAISDPTLVYDEWNSRYSNEL